MSSISVGVRLPVHLEKKLEFHATKANVFKSEAIISALARYLGCSDSLPLSQRVAVLEAKVEELQVSSQK